MATCPKCGGFLRGGGAEVCMNCETAPPAEVAICPHCRSEVPAGATACRFCTRAIRPPSSSVSAETLIGCFGMVFLVVVLYAAFSPSAPTVRTVPKADIETSITIEGACAKSRSALYNLKRAAASGDREAIAGLILRGEAIQVSPSDTVHVISSDGEGVSHVRMLSGFQIGNSCYLPASMLR